MVRKPLVLTLVVISGAIAAICVAERKPSFADAAAETSIDCCAASTNAMAPDWVASAQETSRDLWNRAANAGDPPSPSADAPRFATPVAWDETSAEILPRFFAANGATAVIARVGEARCTIEINATSGAGRRTKGSLMCAWRDADNNGVLVHDEVRVQITDGDAEQMEPYRKQFETQLLCGTPRVLLRSNVKTEKRDDGYVVTIASASGDALERMGLSEMKCSLSHDLNITAIQTKSAESAETFARLRSEKLNGWWFVTQSVRRTAVPGSGLVQETADSEYANVAGLPVQRRMIVEMEVLAPNAETTATMRQEFVFRDWQLVKRDKPLEQPRAAAAGIDAVAKATPPVSKKVEKIRQAAARRGKSSARAAGERRLPIRGVEKYVSPQARFALYKPIGWRVNEAADGGILTISVRDPTGNLTAQLIHGPMPADANPISIARAHMNASSRRSTDVELAGAFGSPDGKSIVFDSLADGAEGGRTRCRNWINVGRDAFTIARCEAPAAQFDQSRSVLLTILMNIQIMRNTIPAAPRVLPLADFRLADGSASFSLPQGWMLERDLGVGHFTAKDPRGLCSFAVASIEVITPQLGVSVPGVPVLPYLVPHRALASLAEFQGILRDVHFVEVIPRSDISAMIAQVYTVGPVEAEECVATYLLNGTPCKSYTFGVSLGSRLGTNWRFNHMSVGAPAAEFDSLVPTLAAMMGSYRINDEFAMRYIAQGMARLRRMQQETAAIIAKNRQEISAMMQAAYDERQRSQDWIDYQRSNYILGRTDWISSMEGGAVYHTDSWGTQNSVTGERWEGSPFNYVNFEGQNPKYDELMTPIDNRRLYEQVFRN